MAEWWNRLSLDEQREYLAQHPKSEFTLQPRAFPPEALAAVRDHLGSPEVQAELAPTVDAAERDTERWDDTTRVELGARIRAAWRSPDMQRRRRAVTQFALKAGVILLTSAVLTGLTGVPTSFYVPALVSFNWNDLPDIRDPRELCSAFGKMFFTGIKAGLMHKLLSGQALTAEPGKPSVQPEQAVAIKSNHESDLNKTLTRLENAVAPVARVGEHACVELARVLQRTTWLESNIPVLGNVLVIASPQRMSLGTRANRLLGAYTAELAACYETAATLTTTPVDRGLQTVIKQHMAVAPRRAHTTLRPDATGRACEYSAFEFDADGRRTWVLGRRVGAQVEIAYAVDSLFLPRKFYTVRTRDLKAWLRANVEAPHAV